MTQEVELTKLVPLQNEVVIPAQAEVTATLKWITAITVSTPSPHSQGSIAIEYLPMTEQGELVYFDAAKQSTLKTITSVNLSQLKSLVPELAAAFLAFLDAVNPIENAIQEQTSSLRQPV